MGCAERGFEEVGFYCTGMKLQFIPVTLILSIALPGF